MPALAPPPRPARRPAAGKPASRPDDRSGFKKRLAQVIGLAGNAHALATTSGVSLGSIRNYQARGEPGRLALIKLAAAVAVRPEWLAFGDGPGPSGGPALLPGTADEVVLLPELSPQAAPAAGSAGAGPRGFAVSRSWLSELGVEPAHTACMAMGDDSMEPFLRERDRAVLMRVETEDPTLAPPRGGIYALSDGGQLQLRRVVFLGQDGLRVAAENPAYPPRDFALADARTRLRLLGRLVGSVRRG